jgi:hypothetical protein
MKRDIRRRYRRQRGSFLMEFSVVAWTLILMLAGAFELGMTLIRAIQASQVVRNANVLTVRSVDLSIPQNQQLLMRTASSLGMNIPNTWNPDPNGNGVVFVTKVLRVGPLECSVGVVNFDGTTKTCPNLGSYVIASRITIGNGTRWGSPLGKPVTAQRPNGDLYDSDICTNSANLANGFPGIIALNQDQYTFVAEIYVDTSKFNLFSFMTAPLIYMRNLS